MGNKKILALYGLKWNPFLQDRPIEAILNTPQVSAICSGIENLVLDGGFALITGESGTGKSAAMRALEASLSEIREITVGSIIRPHSNLLDFYREVSSLFSIDIQSSNRWGGFKALRKKWQDQIKATLFRPVLIIDEAQDMDTAVLSELRYLTSANFDSYLLMTIILCGDVRLLERLRSTHLHPLGTRIKLRYSFEAISKNELKDALTESIRLAGNHNLMTPGLINTLAEHSLGNYRIMMNMGNELLYAAMKKDLKQLDEKLYLEIYHKQNNSQKQKRKLR